MYNLLLLLVLFSILTRIATGIILNKKVHVDGRKEFVILKKIEQNQCTCSCSCFPQTEYNNTTTTTKWSSNRPFVDKITNNPTTWLTDKISKQHSEKDLETKTINSTVKIFTTLNSKAPLEKTEPMKAPYTSSITTAYGFLTKMKHTPQSTSRDFKFETSSPFVLTKTTETRLGTSEEIKVEEEVEDLELRKMPGKGKWRTAREGSMSSSVQAQTDEVTRGPDEEVKVEKEVEDVEFKDTIEKVREGSISSSVQAQTDEVTRGPDEEEKVGKEVGDAEFKDMMEKVREGSMSSSVQAQTDEVTRGPDEEEKVGKEVGDAEFKDMMEKVREGSMSSSVQAQTDEVTRGPDEEEKIEKKVGDVEFKDMMEKVREGSMSSSVQAQTDEVTRGPDEEEKVGKEVGDAEFKDTIEKVREGSISSSVQAQTDEVTRGPDEEEKVEKEVGDVEFKDMMEKVREGSMSSSVQAQTDEVTRGPDEEEKVEKKVGDVEFKDMMEKVREGSMSSSVKIQTDQVTRETNEKEKHKEVIGNLEFKEMVKKGKWRTVREKDSMSSSVQTQTDHVIRGPDEEKIEEKVEDLVFKKILEKEEWKTVQKEEGLISSSIQTQTDQVLRGSDEKEVIEKEAEKIMEKDIRNTMEQEGSMSFSSETQQTDLDQSASANWKLNASFSPFVLMKRDQVTHGSVTDITRATGIARMELIKMISELSTVRQNKTGKDTPYGEEIISTSEIVPMKILFEKKRFDAAKKTNSNDIYIRTHLLTSAPAIVNLSTWNNELQTTNYTSLPSERDTSVVEERMEETVGEMNRTEQESVSISKNDTRKEAMLNDSEINFMETSSNTPSDDVKSKVIEVEMAKSTINVLADVLESDLEHDTYKILGEALEATTIATKLPDKKKTTIKAYWNGSLENETISNDSESMAEFESNGMIFKNNYTTLKNKEVVENDRQKVVSVKDMKMMSTRSMSDSGSHFINHSEIFHERKQTTLLNSDETNTTSISAPSVEDISVHSSISTVFSDKDYSTDAARKNPMENVIIPRFPTMEQGYSQQARNLFKNRKLQVSIMHCTVTFSPLGKRKILEGARRAMPMKIRNRNYAEEERKEKMKSKNEETMRSARLQEEKARLEEARLLREEQMELRKQQELYHGFADEAQLERHEQITQQLEQLAESERQHREQLEREERIRLASTKHYKIRLTGESFSTTPTSITTLSEFDNQTNEGNLLSAPECSLIRKFVSIFSIANPVEWIRLNCSVAKIYFTESNCEHMQKLFASCFQ